MLSACGGGNPQPDPAGPEGGPDGGEETMGQAEGDGGAEEDPAADLPPSYQPLTQEQIDQLIGDAPELHPMPFQFEEEIHVEQVPPAPDVVEEVQALFEGQTLSDEQNSCAETLSNYWSDSWPDPVAASTVTHEQLVEEGGEMVVLGETRVSILSFEEDPQLVAQWYDFVARDCAGVGGVEDEDGEVELCEFDHEELVDQGLRGFHVGSVGLTGGVTCGTPAIAGTTHGYNLVAVEQEGRIQAVHAAIEDLFTAFEHMDREGGFDSLDGPALPQQE